VKGSVYMRWAKEHAAARYNLANSGLLPCTEADLAFGPEDVRLHPGAVASADGWPALREAIAETYGAHPDQVTLAQGTSMANFLALATLVEPGDRVLVEQPTYEPLLAILRFLGAEVARFRRPFSQGFRWDPGEIRDLLRRPARLVVITDPHNPSGVAAETAEVAALGELAAAAGASVLVDEVYRDVAFERAPPSHVHLGPCFLATSSLTKSYGLSSLRCGWVLSTPEISQRMLRVNDFLAATGPLPTESLAVAAFRQLPRLTERARALLTPNREQIRRFLAAHTDWLEVVIPDHSMMVFPRLLRESDSQALHDRLRPRETSIVPGRFFDSPDHFRLGFAVRPEDVARGLEEVSGALRSGSRRSG
jgi:aspartate/methionine/tyrosine aminotransferase